MEIGKQNNGKKKKKRETDESIEFITVEEINRNVRREPGFLFVVFKKKIDYKS